MPDQVGLRKAVQQHQWRALATAGDAEFNAVQLDHLLLKTIWKHRLCLLFDHAPESSRRFSRNGNTFAACNRQPAH